MEIRTETIRGTYEELNDAAEDLGTLLEAVAADAIDLTPVVQAWLTAQLERLELALTKELGTRDGVNGAAVEAPQWARQAPSKGAA